MQLTKAQTIALLIGSASADTTVFMNATSDNKNLSKDSKVTTKNSLTKCDKGPSECTADGETCAQIQSVKSAGEDITKTKVNQCIQEKQCGTVGYYSNTYISAPCWTKASDDGKTAAAAPTLEYQGQVAIGHLKELIIREKNVLDSDGGYKISPEKNFEDGWWNRKYVTDDYYWQFTKSPTITKCTDDSGCSGIADSCCVNYPDNNNKRCIDKSATGTDPKLSTLPADGLFLLKPYMPECETPEQTALRLATEGLKAWGKSQKEASQTSWAKIYDEKVAKQDKKVAEWRKAAGYDTMTTQQQADYDVEILAWKKAAYEACKVDMNSVSCTESETLKDKEEARRVTNKFYTKTADERKKLKEAEEADTKKDIAELTSKQALAKAAEDLKAWGKTQKEAAQKKAKYGDMKADEKTAWDKTYDDKVAKQDKKVAEWKTAAGYDTMTTQQQADYDAELILWKKAVQQACNANANSVNCTESEALKDKEEKRRVANKFYTQTSDERKKLKDAETAEKKKEKAAIIAATVDAEKGAEGGFCSAEEKCTSEEHCCGTGISKDGDQELKLEGICMNSTTLKYKRFEFEYIGTCSAKSMLASATALFTVASLM